MSKMSQLHAELSEQATSLGFETIEDALNSGYHVNYANKDAVKLVKRAGYADAERAKAHEDYLKRKERTLIELRELRDGFAEGGYKVEQGVLDRAIQLIKEGEI